METNAYLMKRHQEALRPIIGTSITIQGTTDLALKTLKFSGNAQRRKRRFLLFHGTFLLHLDIPLIEKLLPIPARQPSYRAHRRHLDFLMNLKIPPDKIKKALCESWNATKPLEHIPFAEIDRLVRDRYATRAWNFKF